MKLGATAAYTYAFRGTSMTLDDYVDSIQSLPGLGLTCFDLEILRPEHIPIYEDPANAERLRSTLETNGVEVAGFTAWMCLEYIHSIDPARRAEGVALFGRVAELAASFGASYLHLGSDMLAEFITERDPTYVTAPATQVQIPAGIDVTATFRDYGRTLAEMAEVAAANGLKFAIEPRANSMITDAHSFLRAWEVASHPNLYCCIDFVHLAYHQIDIPLTAGLLGDRLLVVQACDAIPGEMVHLPLGDGELAIDQIMAGLGRVGFDGFLMLELYRSGEDDKAAVDDWYRAGARRLTGDLAGSGS